MNRKRRNAGFTLAELLIVVGIMILLMGFGTVAVNNYSRSMTSVEYDSAAKEIFVAAQNHLTMAHSQGFYGVRDTTPDETNPTTFAVTEFGYRDIKEPDGVKIPDWQLGDYHFFVNLSGSEPSVLPSSAESIFNQILPPGSIDDTLRRGNYIIRYNAKAGVVRDVFYCGTFDSTGYNLASRYGTLAFTSSDYLTLMKEPSDRKHDYIGMPSRGLTDKFGRTEAEAEAEAKDNRKKYSASNSKTYILGYYGTGMVIEGTMQILLDDPQTYADANPTKGEQNAISLEIENGDKLIAKVTLRDDVWTKVDDTDNGILVKLHVKGKTSGAEKIINLIDNGNRRYIDPKTTFATANNDPFQVILDDVTAANSHFSDLLCKEGDAASDYSNVGVSVFCGKSALIPGEDLEIWAECTSYKKLMPVTSSGIRTTNSLFGEGTKIDSSNNISASISSFRHLENMSPDISRINSGIVKLTAAEQVRELDWAEFKDNIKTLSGTTVVKIYDKIGNGFSDNCFAPVNPAALIYDGKSNAIKNVTISHTGDAGLFGTLAAGSTVQDLELVNFSVTGTGAAGALAGTMPVSGSGSTAEKSTVKNVLARNERDAAASLQISGGSAVGGLVGSMEGGTVQECAAAVYVRSTDGAAGGLIGTMSAGTVTNSYSGGHTGDYTGGRVLYKDETADQTAAGRVNVISVATGSSAAAGGLIGSMAAGTVTNCYSTCSVSGTAAGGFAGIANGSISNSYCTGLVVGCLKMSDTTPVVPVVTDGKANRINTRNAFVGDGSVADNTSNRYYSIVNDNYYAAFKVKVEKASSVVDLLEIEPGPGGATAFDATAAVYNTFCPTSPNPAFPYDGKLSELYRDAGSVTRYPFPTITQLSGTTPTGSLTTHLTAHYGDWPAPETLVVNTPA